MYATDVCYDQSEKHAPNTYASLASSSKVMCASGGVRRDSNYYANYSKEQGVRK